MTGWERRVRSRFARVPTVVPMPRGITAYVGPNHQHEDVRRFGAQHGRPVARVDVASGSVLAVDQTDPGGARAVDQSGQPALTLLGCSGRLDQRGGHHGGKERSRSEHTTHLLDDYGDLEETEARPSVGLRDM